MIIHAYLTTGFYPWAKLFLESYKYHNGEETTVILSTRGLDKQQVAELKSLYKNVVVKNDNFNIADMARKAKMSPKQLLRLKKQVEEKHVTEKNKVWKLMVAADDRVKSVLDVMKEYTHEDYMLHFDIDMYFRDNLKELIKFIKSHDISIRLRLQSKLNRKTMIGIQGYKINKTTMQFVSKWISYVEKVPPHQRPMGYGQSACFYAYRDFKRKVKWGSVPRRFIAPQMYDTDTIWSANTKEGKKKNLEICYQDFERIKNGR